MTRKDGSPPQINLLDDFVSALVKKEASIIEFAESDEYVGKALYPRQRVLLKLIYLEELTGYEEDVLTEWIKSSEEGGEVRISPKIRERVAYLRENGYPHFRTVQLVGGRRSGKGHMTGICIAKKVFDLVQSDDPGVHYGVDRDKDIFIPIIAAKEDQAKWHQYGDAQAAISSCKALQKYIKRIREEGMSIYTPSDIRKEAELRARGVDIVRDMAKIRVMPFASSADTVRGSASIMYVFDEFAFVMQGESRRSAEEIWSAAIPSLAQFGKDAIVFANSSPYSKVGKFFSLYEDSLKLDEEGDPAYMSHLMIQYPSWEMYKDWETDTRHRSAIISYDMPAIREEERKDPDKFKVEYRSQFAETVNAFLDPDKIDAMFLGTFQGRLLTTQHAGVGLYHYKAHGDPSSTTANFGIAIGHVEMGTDYDELANEYRQVPHVVFDLIDAFYPADMPNNVIDWEIVLDTVLTYIQNFRPYEWTFDQFDSTAPIQMLQKAMVQKGLNGTRVALKTATYADNKRRAENFKAALYLGRVHAPNPIGQLNERSMKLAREELKFLQERNGKVVKQELGPVQTKDIADCIMEVTDALIGHTLSPIHELLGSHPEAGAQHGYQMGRGMRGERSFPTDLYSSRKYPGSGGGAMRGMNRRPGR